MGEGCGKHLGESFDAARSKAGKLVSCGPRCPGTCRNGKCAFHMRYLEGSSLEGTWLEDSIRLLDGPSGKSSSSESFRVKFGCTEKETGLFQKQQPSGIFGLAPGSDRRPTIPWQLHQKRGQKTAGPGQVFSLCLQSAGGWLEFGASRANYRSNNANTSKPMQWATL